MRDEFLQRLLFLGFGFFLFTFARLGAQQQDVPEPVFMNFSIQPLYVPVYHGRDPFRIVNHVNRSPQVSIAELDYHGVILLNEKPVALFTWRGNTSVLYTLKFRKLYSWEKEIDGVVGEIADKQVILTQGEQKIVFPRK